MEARFAPVRRPHGQDVQPVRPSCRELPPACPRSFGCWLTTRASVPSPVKEQNILTANSLAEDLDQAKSHSRDCISQKTQLWFFLQYALTSFCFSFLFKKFFFFFFVGGGRFKDQSSTWRCLEHFSTPSVETRACVTSCWALNLRLTDLPGNSGPNVMRLLASETSWISTCCAPFFSAE